MPEIPTLIAALRPPTRAIDFDTSKFARKAKAGAAQPSALSPRTTASSGFMRTGQGHLLSGVTLDAQEWNTVQARNLQSRGKRRTFQRSTSNSKLEEQNEQNFMQTTDQLVTRIGELKRSHDAYEGKPGATLQRKRTGPQQKKDEEKETEEERRRERLEIFKFATKIEPELPPLQQIEGDGKPPPRSCADQSIVSRNSNSEGLAACMPAAVEMRRGAFRAMERQKTATVNIRRIMEMEMLQDSYAAELERKGRQGLNAVIARRQAAVKSKHAQPKEESDPTARLWLALIPMVAFMNTLTADAEVIKRTLMMSPLQRSRSLMTISQNSGTLVALNKQPDVKWTLCLMVHRFRCKLQIGQRRKAAQMMHAAMGSWRHGGRFYVHLIKHMAKIKYSQRWWRRCRARLKEVRDGVSKRWIKLERAEWTRELNKAAPPPGQAHRAGATSSTHRKGLVAMSSPVHSLEERVLWHMVDEAKRLRFIEHELRARRFFLLPEIQLWEKEVISWRAKVDDFQENVDVRKAIGLGARPGSQAGVKLEFRWPPVRPSYLPPEHPITEVKGLSICGDKCIGRVGDQEILGWWNRLRNHPEGKGWREIPKPKLFNGPGKTKKRSSTKVGRCDEDLKPAARPFGEAGDEELLQWGVDPSRMPGLGPRE